MGQYKINGVNTMCENPDSKTTLQKLGHKLLIETQKQEGKLAVDDKNAYFRGKAVPKELWRQQAFQLGLPADIYLDIASLAENSPGSHRVSHGNQTFAVNIGELVQSEYGLHRIVKSVMPYES